MLYHKIEHVTVSAPARLHLGFVDLGGSLGRKFISAGLSIEGFKTTVTVSPAAKFSSNGPAAERALGYARSLFEKINLNGACHVEVHSLVPMHAGLGSGTQLALAVGVAIVKMAQVDIEVDEIAYLLGRGARSGIGVAAFKHGGMIIDGGRGKKTRVPPTLAHHAFPETWRTLLILDQSDAGLHGTHEADAFSTLPEFSDQCAANLSRQVLTRILPGIVEKDVREFGLGVSEIQQRIGDYFAPAQGGRYTSKAVAEVIGYLIEKDIPGVGQSSWGPTGFAFFDSETHAHAMLRQLQQKFSHLTQLSFKVVAGDNVGANIAVKKYESNSNLEQQSQ